MRVRDGYDLLSTLFQENPYPSKSPTPAPKMVGCILADSPKASHQRATCLTLQYCFTSRGKEFCRAPETWVEFCPNAQPDKRPALVPQKHKVAKPDLPRGIGSQNRRTRRFRRIKQWVLTELSHLLNDPHLSTPASILFYDKDETMTREQYDALADRLWRDWSTR